MSENFTHKENYKLMIKNMNAFGELFGGIYIADKH